MKVFVTGVNGQLGHDVVNELLRRGHEAVGSDVQAASPCPAPYVALDITDPEAVQKAIAACRPDAVIHCAAWTNVDAAEDPENRVTVDAVNHLGIQYIAEAARAVDVKMVYISTDYVFDGQGSAPLAAG